MGINFSVVSYLEKIQIIGFFLAILLFGFLYICDQFEILKKYVTDGYKICIVLLALLILIIIASLEKIEKSLRNCTGFLGCSFNMLLDMIFSTDSWRVSG